MFSLFRKKGTRRGTEGEARADLRDEDNATEGGDASSAEEIVSRYVAPNLTPGAKVLEIGCGGGRFSERLAALGGALVCADVSPEMLERARARLDGKKGVAFQRISGFGLHEFDPGVFDIVFSFDAFTRYPMEEAYSCLGEVRRVLSPGGKGFIRFANLSSPEGWQRFAEAAPFRRGRTDSGIRAGFLTWEIVELFMASLGFEILDRRKEPLRDILVLFRKPA